MNRLATLTIVVPGCASLLCAQTQTSNSTSSPGNGPNLANGTAIIAKLISGLDTAQCEPGDFVDVQVVHNVKQGSQVVVTRGALVIGKIAKVQASPDSGGLYGVWVIFDNVAAQAGAPSLLRMDIQAVAPPPSAGTDNLNGRDTGALMDGHRTAVDGRVDDLTAKSAGAIGLPDVNVAFQDANGSHISMLVSKKGNFHLVKGSQDVFRVVGP